MIVDAWPVFEHTFAMVTVPKRALYKFCRQGLLSDLTAAQQVQLAVMSFLM